MIITPAQLNRRAELYHQLGSMVAAGVPLIKGLEMVSASPAIRGSRNTILGLIQCLKTGMTFSDSMKQVQGWMPEFDIALLAVGEEAGRLDASFRLLSTYYASRASVIRDAIAGLVTTAATVHVFLLIFPLSYLIAFVQGLVFGDISRCLPFLIEKAAVFGALYGGIVFLVYALQGQRAEGWRTMVEGVTQVVPVLRRARQYLALSRLAGSLEAATASGVSLFRAWELASAASASPRLQREISRWRPQLESGVTPAELINQSSSFPAMFANLYHTAEQSGKVEEALHRLQVYYQEEGTRSLRLFTRLLNGTIYAIVVAIVAINVIGFYMNYYGAMFRGF